MADEEHLKHDRTPIYEKVVVKAPGGGVQVYGLSPARPFSDLPGSALLDSADLCILFGCSARSIYRWMSERGLRWDRKIGREYLFRKDDVLDFYRHNLPPLGRPPKRRR